MRHDTRPAPSSHFRQPSDCKHLRSLLVRLSSFALRLIEAWPAAGTTLTSLVPLALAASLLVQSSWLQALVRQGWGGNFLVSLVFSVALTAAGEAVLTAVGGESLPWRLVMSLWTLQFFLTSFACHPHVERLQALAERWLTRPHALPCRQGSGHRQAKSSGTPGAASAAVAESEGHSCTGAGRSWTAGQPAVVDSLFPLHRNWLWRLSWGLYVYPACAVLMSLPLQRTRLQERFFREAYTEADVFVLQ